MPNLDGECAERIRLGHSVTTAIEELASLAVARGQVSTGSSESTAMEAARHCEARAAYRQAAHALDEHVASHRCDR